MNSTKRKNITQRLAEIERKKSLTATDSPLATQAAYGQKTLSERLVNIQQRHAEIIHETESPLETCVQEGAGPRSQVPNSEDQASQLHHQVASLSITYRVQGRLLEVPQVLPELYNAGRYYSESRHILNTLPSTLISSFNVLLQNLFSEASQKSSAAALAGIKHVREQVLKETRGTADLTPMDKTSLQHMPGDIRTVHRMFKNLDPETTTYACCPDSTCCALYPPSDSGDSLPPQYPPHCTQLKFGIACNTPLISKCTVINGTSVPQPTKPYVYHHFNDHVAGMLSRPGVEDAIESYTTTDGKFEAELSDIMSSKAIHNFRDTTGQPFLRKDGSELRLVWALAADWFNPFSNKASGKAVSTGLLAMICLSLPPNMRYLEENIYLSGVIPGPHEPALDATNPFLEPLMHDLNASYSPGTYFSRTHKYPAGRSCRSAIIPLIADTLASKKVSGHCGHAGKYFCSRCRLPHNQIGDLDHKSWPAGLTRAQHEDHADTWRSASSKAKQKFFAKKYGVRWSALLLLSYWEPSEWSIQEGFHVLLLGVVPRHCRDLLSLNFKDLPKDEDGDGDTEDIPTRVMEHAHEALTQNSPRKLQKLGMDVLKALCQQKGCIPLPGKHGRQCKKDYIGALMGLQSSGPSTEPDLYLASLFDGVEPEEQTTSPQVEEAPLVSGKHAVITQQMLSKIREHISLTLRPAWQAHLPQNFGSPEHGKLKADQWRTALEFDIPVSLIKLLSEYRPSGRIHDDSHFCHLVENTLDLAMALAWGLSQRTSESHAEKYIFYMHRYLTGVQQLFPDYKLKPVHHYALHICDILLLFGPLHGTWAFTLERLIGLLQGFNTNSKIGEMESTVLKMFCRRTNLIRWMSSDDCPSVLKTAWKDFRSHRNLHDLSCGVKQSPFTAGVCSERSSRHHSLDPDIQDAFLKAFRPAGDHVHFHCSSVTVFHYYKQAGVLYSDPESSQKHSLVYYNPLEEVDSGESLIPAQICQIFQHCHINKSQFVMEIFITIHPYQPYTPAKDYFAPFRDFRAGLFHQEPSSEVKVIRASKIYCHANQRPWDDQTVVMRAVDRNY